MPNVPLDLVYNTSAYCQVRKLERGKSGTNGRAAGVTDMRWRTMRSGGVLAASLARHWLITCAAAEFGVVLDVSVSCAQVGKMDGASRRRVVIR